jgi:hypothetical protein
VKKSETSQNVSGQEMSIGNESRFVNVVKNTGNSRSVVGSTLHANLVRRGHIHYLCPGHIRPVTGEDPDSTKRLEVGVLHCHLGTLTTHL